MENKEKAINVVKEIIKREDETWKQCKFCIDHNFNLEAEKFKAIESELRRLRRLIEKEFEINGACVS